MGNDLKPLYAFLALALALAWTVPARAEIHYYDASGNRVTAEEFRRMVRGNVAPRSGEEAPPTGELGPAPDIGDIPTSITLIDPVNEMVDVEGEEQLYYRFSATFKGREGGTLVFHPDSCVLYGMDHERYETCYIRVRYMSPGAKTLFEGDQIAREMLIRKIPDNPESVEPWNTFRIVGGQSKLTCSFEENGFLSMDFLWPVPDTFRVGTITLLGSVVRRSPVAETQEQAKAAARVSEESLPPFTTRITGVNHVKFSNPNGFSVNVSLRDGEKGLDFTVFPQDSLLVDLPDGSFDVYFVYSSQPRSLYRGQTFYLQRGKATFTILRTADGQYALTPEGE